MPRIIRGSFCPLHDTAYNNGEEHARCLNHALIWEYNEGAKEDDFDGGAGDPGDGLTRYEEYTGFIFEDEGGESQAMGQPTGVLMQANTNRGELLAAPGGGTHSRTSPARKDLFVDISGFDVTGDFKFVVGDAFKNAGIDVHASSTGWISARSFDRADITLENSGDHISRRDIRDWVFSLPGQSTVGTATNYGSAEAYKKSHEYYFSDKPYVDGNTWTAPGTWGGAPNGILDPLNKVEDTNDSGGVPDANEKDGAATLPLDDGDTLLDGDRWWTDVNGHTNFSKDLNPNDPNNDGKIDGFPVSVTRALMVKHTITHELGHAVGIAYSTNDGHCTESTCLMYKYTIYGTEGHFCDSCKAKIKIH